jgi:signal transduction histidine kinase
VRGDAVVSIADDGVGLAAEHVTRVFDSFFTTKCQATRKLTPRRH